MPEILVLVIAGLNASGVRDGFGHRASSVLDGLDTAAQPFPGLQDSLSATRAELELA